MLEEILILALTVLPNWLALLLLSFDWYDKKKNKRADRAGDNKKPGGNRA